MMPAIPVLGSTLLGQRERMLASLRWFFRDQRETGNPSLSVKHLLHSDLVPKTYLLTYFAALRNTQRLFVFFILNFETSTTCRRSTLAQMEDYHLLDQGEPTSEHREMSPTLHRSCRASQPTMMASVTMGAILLLVSACGNVLQYRSSGYGNDDSCRSQVGGSEAPDGLQ